MDPQNIQKVLKTEKGVIASLDKKKKKISFLCPPIHLLFYKEKGNTFTQVACLDYGIFAEGKDEESSRRIIVSLIEDFIKSNTKKSIKETLSSLIMESFWAMYRVEETNHFPLEIDIQDDLEKTKQQKKSKNLEKENSLLVKKLQEIKHDLRMTEAFLEEVTNQKMMLETELNKLIQKIGLSNALNHNDEPVFIRSNLLNNMNMNIYSE